ncbi:MAG: hypothetical protein OSJ24_02265 [Muribaculaceae bacterium]|nr:hypothetical protein [Muribaculaceae bacterium]
MWTGNVRAKWHDYSGRAIYHLTLMKSADAGDFGTLAGSLERPFIAASAIGTAIKQVLRELPEIHPSLHLYQYALMPDHLHLLMAVDGPLDDILGRKLAAFKVRVNKLSGIEQVFANGFNDQILKPGRSLDAIYSYLRENPYKLAVRRAHPEFRLSSVAAKKRFAEKRKRSEAESSSFRTSALASAESRAPTTLTSAPKASC